MIKNTFGKIKGVLGKVMDAHVGAYAAQSAYFLVLSMIPIILLLLTAVQFTLITKADVILAVKEVFPKTVNATVISIVEQVYNQSRVVIPVTIIIALWSAGRGVLAMSTGLNCIYECKETRNYVFLRVRATFYTVMFIVAIIVSLVLLVFGNSISLFVNAHIPIMSKVTDFIIEIRTTVSLIVLIFFSMFIYRFLPNHKVSYRKQLPGALFYGSGLAGCLLCILDVFGYI